MPRSDDAWLAALRGETEREEATAELHRFLRGALARGFGRQLSDADLDDLAQESVMREVERLSSFRGASRFTTWAASIAVNRALGELRKRKHRHRSLQQAVELGRQAFTGAEIEQAPEAPQRLQRSRVERALGRAIDEALTETQREALLAELGGLPLMEIARRTGRKRGALYKLLHQARKRLRAHLEGQGISGEDLAEGLGA